MKDMSYELLDMMEEQGWDEAGISRILENGQEPWILEALSPIRENLVDWLEITKEQSVLELGCGYGALTGALARKAGSVEVMDSREENLEIGRRRWSQMGNVSWRLAADAGNAADPAATEDRADAAASSQNKKYDWVFLIGPRTKAATLGIAGQKERWNREEEERAYLAEQIKQAASLVKAGGHLAFAIPNRNGLKYWAGAAPEEEEASMSLMALRELFGAMGGKAEVYYPLPDYKLPTAIYSDRYLPVQGELPSLYAEYEKPRYRLFSEEAAYDAVCQTGGFPQFANSFFVIWEKL